MLTSALKSLRDCNQLLQGEHHIGVLVPWANTVVETELPLLSDGRIVWHHSRLMPDGRQTVLDDEFLVGINRAVPFALEQLSKLRLPFTFIACTSAGFRFLPSDEEAEQSRTHAPVVSAFDALVECLKYFGASRVILLTPYPADLGLSEERQIALKGFEVLGGKHLDVPEAFAAIETYQIDAMLGAFPDSVLAHCDAVVLSCTAWHTLSAIKIIEDRLHIPAISSNLAIAMSAARRCANIITS